MKFTSICAILFAALTLAIDVSASIVIDNYTAGDSITLTAPGTESQVTTDASILGNARVDTLTLTNTASPFFGTIGFNGVLDVAQGAADQVNGSVTYSNFGTTGIIDITEGGINDAFELGFLTSDINSPLSNVVSVTATSANGATDTQFVTVPASSGLPADVLLSFDAFDSAVDFTTLDSVSLNFDFASAPGRDLGVGLFSAVNSVPEPTTGLICGIAAVGMVVRRRRR